MRSPRPRPRGPEGIRTPFFALALLPGCLDRPIEPVEPRTTTTVVERLAQTRVDKIDILLAIDNSRSMADKQKLLARAVPDLVGRLSNPICVDLATGARSPVQPDGPLSACPEGSMREFEPVTDIHVGIVSSSLGALGESYCQGNQPEPKGSCPPEEGTEAELAPNPTTNDSARLVARADPLGGASVPTHRGMGYLAWDPERKLEPPGEDDAAAFTAALTAMVSGVGQVGCGFEAQLESVYRFLVEPDPPASMRVEGGVVVREGKDTTLLGQRAAFLRPDSLVAVVMLTDENDCSFREDAAVAAHLDAASVPGNHVNLRCHDLERRFGKDLLHPISRYADGFSKPEVQGPGGALTPNPLFSGGRSPDLFFFAGIVGVPWQDVARDPEDLGKGLKTAREMAEDLGGFSTWDLVLGDPSGGVRPSDPLMVESEAPRTGAHPLADRATVFAEAAPTTERNDNPVNGNEWIPTEGDDLQYACVFPLPGGERRDCTLICHASCDCEDDPHVPGADHATNPLCEGETPTQFRAKAYPGLRELEVIRTLGDQGIVASVCPAEIEDELDDTFGYRPAVASIVDRLKARLGGQCLPRQLSPDEEGRVSCLVLEARKPEGACSCGGEGRSPVSGPHRAASEEVQKDASVRAAGLSCVCEIDQLVGAAAASCATEPDPAKATGHGFCYVDPAAGIGAPALVSGCPATERRRIRFVGEGEPAPGSVTFITCAGE